MCSLTRALQGTANGGFFVRDRDTNKQHMYPGILDRLQAALYPFDPQDPWKRSKYGITSRRAVQALPVRLPGASGASQCALSGAQHGDLVHRQMEHWANCVKVFGIEQGTQAFLGEHPADKPKKALDPCTRRLMVAFKGTSTARCISRL